MKYVKHLTLKEWNRFKKPLLDSEGNFSIPGNEYQYRNFNTQKLESLATITGQELLLSKYIIILDNFEPKWERRYHTLTKYVNQKNLDKSINSFNKAVNAFSSGLEPTKKNKDHDILFGKKKGNTALWGKKKNVSIWGEKPKRRKKKSEDDNVPLW